MKNLSKMSLSTRAIHSPIHEGEYGSLTFPIYATSTIVFDNAKQGGDRFAGNTDGYIYSRLGNPSTTYLETKIASLEGCESALALSSGMGAIATVLLTALSCNDHIIADTVLYGCTHALIEHQLTKFGIEVTFVDFNDFDLLEASIKSNTKMLFFETPANPTLKIIDIEKIAQLAKKHKLMSVIDNTVSTPYITRPKEFGIDVIVHSATKYLNGHGDVIAGLICGDKDFLLRCRLEGQKDITGSVMSAFDAFLINRGLKTLSVRMERHSESAMLVAQFLESHPKVEIVYYPGLKNHLNHDVAKKQMSIYSGLIAFEVIGGYDSAQKLADSLELFKLAVSLGDCESLVQHPASMTHSPYCEQDRLKAGIKDNLLRISVGLEDVNDIIDDLKKHLDNL